MSFQIPTALVLALMTGVLFAQEADERPREIPEGASARLTILALGPGDYSFMGGQDLTGFEKLGQVTPLSPDQIPDVGPAPVAPDGALPYTTLYYDASGFQRRAVRDDDEPKWKQIRCGFNNASGSTKVHAGKSLKLHYRSRENPQAPPKEFITIPALEPAKQYLVILTPKSIQRKLWSGELNIRMFDLSENEQGKNPVYLCNLTSKEIAFRLGENPPVLLEPGSSKKQSLTRKRQAYQLQAFVADTKEKIFNSGISASSANVSVIVFYPQVPSQNAGSHIAFFMTTQHRNTEEELAEIIPPEES